MSHFSGQFKGQKSLGPLKMSLEMAHKVIVPQKNYVPQFLKQQDINSYFRFAMLLNKQTLCLFKSNPVCFYRKYPTRTQICF
jgi:hypothetical protein